MAAIIFSTLLVTFVWLTLYLTFGFLNRIAACPREDNHPYAVILALMWTVIFAVSTYF